ncbi:MAG: MarR family transcriptional regulator [Steroidobacteraceae bacterium]|nr:MarR family transcriptional regulator [Steroidobacteraceae bacterium]
MSRQPPDRIELERFLPYRLSVLTNVVSGSIAAAYQRRFGLGIPEWRVIAVLARHPGLSAAEVAAFTRMDAVAVSRAVTRLVRAGRLRRSVAGDDRRRSVLRLSPAGRAVYRRIAPLALDYERELLDCLDARQVAELDSIIGKLTARAHSLAAPQRGDGP